MAVAAVLLAPAARAQSSDEALRAAGAARSQEALPGATVAVAPGEPDGRRLAITVARPDPGLVARAQLGWRAHLIAGVVAAERPELTQVSLAWEGIDPQDAQRLTLRTRARSGAAVFDLPNAGTLPVATGVRQLERNVATLRAALPDAVDDVRIAVVAVDRERSEYGLEADLHGPDLEAFAPRIGDVVDGLATGLAGDRTAAVEGLAITLADDAGRRAGWWRSARTATGFAVPGVLGDAEQSLPRLAFDNLTGGPYTLVSVGGGGGVLPPAAPVRIVPGRAVGRARLGMRRRAVGCSPHPRIRVRYDRRGRVKSASTAAPRVSIYGRTIATRAQARRVLGPRGWALGAAGARLRQGDRLTTLRWERGRLVRSRVARRR